MNAAIQVINKIVTIKTGASAKHTLISYSERRVLNMTDIIYINDCYELWKQMNQTNLNPLTFRRYTNLLETHLLPYFEYTAMQSITEKDIHTFLKQKQEEDLAEVSRNMLITLLKKLIQTAGIDTVALGLEHTIHVKQQKRSIEILNYEEQLLLDEILTDSGQVKYLGICFAYKMGLAIGEICALSWSDINLKKEVVSIRNTVQRIQNTEEEGKKTLLVKMELPSAAQRELPIPKTVFEQLLLYKKSDGYVLEGKEGKLPDPRREQMRLEKLFQKKEMKGCSFHSLRDTFAVKCLRAGMSMEDLSYVLGHSSVTVTSERYQKFLERKENQMVLKRIMEMV